MSIKNGVTFDMLPIPPSENEAYPTNWKTGLRFTGKEMEEFKKRCTIWSLKRAVELSKLIEELKWELADHRAVLRIDVELHFQYDSLFTKANPRARRKKMDPHNKIKALFDCIAAMLGVDDSRFIVGEVLPIVRTDPAGQFVRAHLSLDLIQTDVELESTPRGFRKI